MSRSLKDDMGTLPLGNGFDDRQAQTAARHVCALTTIEAIKYVRPVCERNPRSRVCDFDLNGIWRLVSRTSTVPPAGV